MTLNDSGFTYSMPDNCGGDWHADKYDIRIMLIDKGLWDAVDPAGHPEPSVDITRAQEKALAAIYFSLHPSYRTYIRSCKTGTFALRTLGRMAYPPETRKNW